MKSSICRIGVFYDGSYFSYAQRYYYHERKLGWLSFQPFHEFLQHFVGVKEQGAAIYKVVYASWHQGLFSPKDATEDQLRSDRKLDHDLLHAGIEPKYLPMSPTQGEKGTDVALAVDALQIGLADKIDIAVLVSGDADFVPLVRVLNKQGVRVVAAYFQFTPRTGNPSFINERLLNCINYPIDISSLEEQREFKTDFKNLFRTPDDWKNNESRTAVSGGSIRKP